MTESMVSSYDEEDGDDVRRSKQVELATACYFRGRKAWAKGDKEEALAMFRRAVAIQESALGTRHKDTARSYYFLGYALSKHSKDDDRALVAYRRTLRIRLSLNGEDDISTEDVLRAIRELLKKKGFKEEEIEEYFSLAADSVRLEKDGGQFAGMGQCDRAIEAYLKCLTIEETAAGRFPLDVGQLYVRIAQVHRQEGEYEASLVAYRNALVVYESALGREHPDSLSCLEGIEYCAYKKNVKDASVQEYLKSVFDSIDTCRKADALLESNELEKAVEEYERALDIEEGALGKYPVTAASIRKKLGLAFLAMGSYQRSILELRTVLSINIFEYGSDHQSVIEALKDLGAAMKEQGIDPTAINKYMNTVSFSVKHERYGEHLLATEKDYSGAIEEFQKSLALEVSALGKYHLTQAALFKQIGSCFFEQDNFDFAIVNFRNALLIYQPALGRRHTHTVNTLLFIGEAARGVGLIGDDMDKYRKNVSESIDLEKEGESMFIKGASEEAIGAYTAAITKEESSLGEFHLSMADLYGKIANILKSTNQFQRALVKYRAVLAIYERTLDPEHPNTAKAYQALVEIAALSGLGGEAASGYGQKALVSIEHEARGDFETTKQRHQDATNEYRKALEIEEAALGKSHMVTAVLHGKLADAKRLSKRSDLAIYEYRRAIQIYVTHRCPDHETSKILLCLGSCIEDLGFSKAKGLHYQQIIRESVQCEERGDHAEECGNHIKAFDQYRRCISLEESVLGKLHLSTCSMYKKIAAICRDRGDYESAVVFYSKVLAIQESHLGKDDENTVESYNDLLNAAQKQATTNGTKLDGWMTLQYVLMGLIGLLVMVASLTQMFSNKKKFVKRLDMFACESGSQFIGRTDSEGSASKSFASGDRSRGNNAAHTVQRKLNNPRARIPPVAPNRDTTDWKSTTPVLIEDHEEVALKKSILKDQKIEMCRANNEVDDGRYVKLSQYGSVQSKATPQAKETHLSEIYQTAAVDKVGRTRLDHKIRVPATLKMEEHWQMALLSESLHSSSLHSPDKPVRQQSWNVLPQMQTEGQFQNSPVLHHNQSSALSSSVDQSPETSDEGMRNGVASENSVSKVYFPKKPLHLLKHAWEKKVPSQALVSPVGNGTIDNRFHASEATVEEKKGQAATRPKPSSPNIPQLAPSSSLGREREGKRNDAHTPDTKPDTVSMERVTAPSNTNVLQRNWERSGKIAIAKRLSPTESKPAPMQIVDPTTSAVSVSIPTDAKKKLDELENNYQGKEANDRDASLSEGLAAYQAQSPRLIIESHDKETNRSHGTAAAVSTSATNIGLTDGPSHESSTNNLPASFHPSRTEKQTQGLVDGDNAIPASSRLRSLCNPKSSKPRPSSRGSESSASISLSSFDTSFEVEAEDDEAFSLGAASSASSASHSCSSTSSGQMNLASRLVAYRRQSSQKKLIPSYTPGTGATVSSKDENQHIESPSASYASIPPSEEKMIESSEHDGESTSIGNHAEDAAAVLSVADRMKAFGGPPQSAQNQGKFNAATFR